MGLIKRRPTRRLWCTTLVAVRLTYLFLELGDCVFEVKSTNGDTHLGGADFDRVIINYFADELKKSTV